jgi:hypothetical protein
MQGANKKTGKLPKKLKLTPNEAATAETNTDENSDHDTVHERSLVDKSSSCDPTTGPASLETTNTPAAAEPNIMEGEESLDVRTQYAGDMAGSALASPVDGDGGVPGSDLSAIIHADGLAILDEYFPKLATGLGPLSGVLAPEPSTPPACVALPDSPGVWTAPSAGPDAEFPRNQAYLILAGLLIVSKCVAPFIVRHRLGQYLPL